MAPGLPVFGHLTPFPATRSTSVWSAREVDASDALAGVRPISNGAQPTEDGAFRSAPGSAPRLDQSYSPAAIGLPSTGWERPGPLPDQPRDRALIFRGIYFPQINLGVGQDPGAESGDDLSLIEASSAYWRDANARKVPFDAPSAGHP
jgi:hypothetical protein